MAPRASSPAAPLAAFILCALIWGSTWVAIKVGYGGLAPFTAAAMRFGLAGLLLFGVIAAARLPWPTTRLAWRLALVEGVLIVTLDYGLIYWGEQFLESGLTAVLFATFPLLTALLAHALLPDERLTGRALGGILLGVLGLVVVFGDRLRVEPALLPPMAAIVGAACCAALAAVLIQRDGAGVHPATYSAPGMTLGAALLGLVALARGEALALPSGSAAWASVLYLAAFGSVVAFLAYFWLLQRWGSPRASLLVLLTPLIALGLGAALLTERVDLATGLGTALVLLGVGVTLRAPRRGAGAGAGAASSPEGPEAPPPAAAD